MSFCLLFLLSSTNKSFLSTYCGCWTLSEALAIQGFSWTERRAYICRMDPPLPCSSVTICLVSCPEFFCGMNNNKSIPLVGPGILGQASGRVQAGNSGRKQMSPLLLRETTPCPCTTASAGPLSCLPAPPCPRVRHSGSLWEGLTIPGFCPLTSLTCKCPPKDHQVSAGDAVLSLFSSLLTSCPFPIADAGCHTWGPGGDSMLSSKQEELCPWSCHLQLLPSVFAFSLK